MEDCAQNQDVDFVDSEFQNHALLKALMFLNGFIINFAYNL